MKDAQWWNWVFMGSGALLLVHTIAKRKDILAIASARFSRTHPDWELKAKKQASFKLYEAACLFERSEPKWPLPSDQTERRYEEIVEKTATSIRPTAFEEWDGAIHEFELDRRSVRNYYRRSMDHYEKRLPWFFREKFDKSVPPGLDERDIRRSVS